MNQQKATMDKLVTSVGRTDLRADESGYGLLARRRATKGQVRSQLQGDTLRDRPKALLKRNDHRFRSSVESVSSVVKKFCF